MNYSVKAFMIICHVTLSVQLLPSHIAYHDQFDDVVLVLAHNTCVHLDWFTASLLQGSAGSSQLVASFTMAMGPHKPDYAI